MPMHQIGFIIAFFAGIVSFISPCILPLVPAFLAYLTGVSAKEIESGSVKARSKIFFNAVFFVLGFTIIFALAGILLSSLLAGISFQLRTWFARVGGVIIILFGLYLLKLIRIPFLEREHKIHIKKKFKYSYVTSFVFGSTFAIGWTPCVGAILGAILTLAVVNPGSAFGLLLAYSFGLGIPFLLTGLFISQASGFIKKHQKALKYFNYAAGVILIVLGIFVFTNKLGLISNFAFALRIFENFPGI